ncbi:hypothetical protein [Streptomyces swartbergensis]|uniref:hypothetical protein n=1 Tax=Streptomyces swartbergensis TaxID=487165 RepID=UPI003822AF0B
MKLVTRAQLGWPASAAPAQTKTKGVKVHYEGTAVSQDLLTNHALRTAEWKAIRKAHLANKVENYSDVAYNYAACPHGYLLEGRGIGKRTGVNGNPPEPGALRDRDPARLLGSHRADGRHALGHQGWYRAAAEARRR